MEKLRASDYTPVAHPFPRARDRVSHVRKFRVLQEVCFVLPEIARRGHIG